jgi:hypothetical protein
MPATRSVRATPTAGSGRIFRAIMRGYLPVEAGNMQHMPRACVHVHHAYNDSNRLHTEIPS